MPDIHVLREEALRRRPDLQTVAVRLRAAQADLALAEKEFCLDIEVTAAYDSIMGNGPTRDLAPQVGVRINLPVRKSRRLGAIAEAQARISQRRAELDKQIDLVNFEVQGAFAQAQES